MHLILCEVMSDKLSGLFFQLSHNDIEQPLWTGLEASIYYFMELLLVADPLLLLDKLLFFFFTADRVVLH